MNTNFDCAYKKASGRLRLLQNVRKYLTVDAPLKIFRMIILSILTYGSTVKTTFTETQKEKLISLQNRTKSIIRSEDVPNINDVIKCESCMLVKKCLEQKIQNPTFEEYFALISHEKGTRNNNCLLRLPRVKLEIAKQIFYNGGAKLYNALPLDIRSVQSVVQFRKGLKDRDRGAIFGLRGPNAELPTWRETGWGSEFTGLRQQQ